MHHGLQIGAHQYLSMHLGLQIGAHQYLSMHHGLQIGAHQYLYLNLFPDWDVELEVKCPCLTERTAMQYTTAIYLPVLS